MLPISSTTNFLGTSGVEDEGRAHSSGADDKTGDVRDNDANPVVKDPSFSPSIDDFDSADDFWPLRHLALLYCLKNAARRFVVYASVNKDTLHTFFSPNKSMEELPSPTPKRIPWIMAADTPEKQRYNYLLSLAAIAVNQGFVPILLRGKVPAMRAWQNLRNNPQDIEVRVRGVAHVLDGTVGTGPGIAERNIGILTGAPSGIVVVDVDLPGLELWKAMVATQGLPETMVVATPSGGAHYYFRYERTRHQNLRTRRSPRGIDIRSDGGMVVYPGSSDDRGQIYYVLAGVGADNMPVLADMPDWVARFLETL